MIPRVTRVTHPFPRPTSITHLLYPTNSAPLGTLQVVGRLQLSSVNDIPDSIGPLWMVGDISVVARKLCTRVRFASVSHALLYFMAGVQGWSRGRRIK